MAKSKSAKRKRNAQAEQSQKAAKTITASADRSPLEPKSLHTVIPDDELDVTIETLATLARYPCLIKSKACRDLRAAVYDFRQACTTGANTTEGTNLTGRITAALTDGKYTDARIMLAEMRICQDEPKLGAMCRWVRDLDVISGLSNPEGVPADLIQRSEKETELLKVLDAVLRVTGPTDSNTKAVSHATSPVVVQEIWDVGNSSLQYQVYASVLNKNIFDEVPSSLSKSLRVIETTPAALRKPPNNYDAILYTSAPDTIPLATEPPAITYHTHPHVPSLGLATNVLSPAECKAIIAAGEAVNFVPDAPLREDGNNSVLAHNFYWVVDTAFHDALWERVRAFVPASVGGRLARGLNRRFRVYRYVPGAEYRCHIDGAWPPSGVRPDDTYVYDDSPPGRKQSSLFTFLVYLNDEFEGGETTFFLPAAREGVLNAYPVRPVMGGVAMFPHGEARGALLHEGTGVRKGGKYIIRTDVEYDVAPLEGE